MALFLVWPPARPVARARATPPLDRGLNYRSTFFPCLNEASRARRFAVRFFAAAVAAFFARALRSAAVMFFAAFFPPWLPYAFPSLRRYSRTSGGMRLDMV